MKGVLNGTNEELRDKLIPATNESSADASVLLTFINDFTVENIKFHCRKVRTGLWVHSGSVTLKNCVFLGNRDSPARVGIRVSAGAKVRLVNCKIHGFAIGILCESSGEATLDETTIENCGIDEQSTESHPATEQIIQEAQYTEEAVKPCKWQKNVSTFSDEDTDDDDSEMEKIMIFMKKSNNHDFLIKS